MLNIDSHLLDLRQDFDQIANLWISDEGLSCSHEQKCYKEMLVYY